MAHKGLMAWAFLGILGLVFQATFFFKDSLAAHHPQWQPELEAFCKWTGCQISPLKVLDAVLIDHAAIDLISEPETATPAAAATPEIDGSQASLKQWRFQITLRNAQNYSVAMPWIELTLTDSQDQAVMRQVFDPLALGAPKVLNAGETWSQDLKLRLQDESMAFAAYRLLAFYP